MIHPDDRAAYLSEFISALQARKPFHAQGRVRRSDGEWRWVASYGAPRFSASGECLGMVGSSPDISEIKMAQQLLASEALRLQVLVQDRTAKLQDTVEQLEAFCYTLVHDMRAPLRSMIGFSQALAEEYGPGLDQIAKDYLDRIGSAAVRMDRLIQDVLVYAQYVGRELPTGPVDLDRLVRALVQDYPAFQPSTNGPRVEISSPLLAVIGNDAALAQCLSNLLENAIKFIAPGTAPRVRIWAEARGARVRLWIEDNGIGIEPQFRDRIFHIFERLHPVGTYEGTGIGLAIVRRAVQRMGGKVGVDSESGQGSRFWIELPRAG